jgi:hypothetical protein
MTIGHTAGGRSAHRPDQDRARPAVVELAVMAVSLQSGTDTRPSRFLPGAGRARRDWHDRPVPTVQPAAVPALAPVAILAAASLWWPEHGDQALFEVAGRALNEGSVYYRDFWDIKQPGIYWFYALGERAWPGGPDTAGLGTRILEALLAVSAGWLVLVVVAQWPLHRWVRRCSPTLVVGPYLIWSAVGGVGQVEGLMTVTVLAVLALTWPSPTATRPGAWFAAGLVVGGVALLKTLYLPLVVAPMAIALVAGRRTPAGPARRPDAVRATAAALGAAAAPVAAAGHLAQHGVLGLALRTTFVLPWQVTANPVVHPASSFGELLRSLTNLTPLTGPLAVVAFVATAAAARGHRDRVLPPLTAPALTTIAVLAVGLALPQFPTPYRLLLLAAPVGLLAVAGLQHVADRATGRALRAATVVVLVGLALLTGRQLGHLLRSGGPTGLDLTSRVSRGDNGTGASARRAAAEVASRVPPRSPVYVFGDPRILLLLNARQGAEVTGWSMEMQPASVWHELTRELARSRPALVFVDPTFAAVLAGTPDAAGVRDLLAGHYQVLARTTDGTWYVTPVPGSPIPAPDGVRLGS